MKADFVKSNRSRRKESIPEYNMRVEDIIKQCVVFIGIEENGKFSACGTAFLVGIPRKSGIGCFNYLVTAHHVADKISRGGPIAVRFNLKNGDSIIASVSKYAGSWTTHSDKSIDVAVFHLENIPESKNIEGSRIPLKMFVTQENIASMKMGLGDEVFTAGLFSPFPGDKQNIPLIRIGSLAMIPNEKIPVDPARAT